MTNTTPAAKTCPLCGSDNQCAVAAGRPLESCWCQSATIDAKARAKAKAKAADTTRKRCLCPACGQPSGEKQGER